MKNPSLVLLLAVALGALPACCATGADQAAQSADPAAAGSGDQAAAAEAEPDCPHARAARGAEAAGEEAPCPCGGHGEGAPEALAAHVDAAGMASPEAVAAAVAALAPGTWYCPMHPEQNSSARDRCTVCGMYYEQKAGGVPGTPSGTAVP